MSYYQVKVALISSNNELLIIVPLDHLLHPLLPPLLP
jgi:hypothetical protein